jgi:hypothetical protein
VTDIGSFPHQVTRLAVLLNALDVPAGELDR